MVTLSVTLAWKKAGTMAPAALRAAASLTQTLAGTVAGVVCAQYLLPSANIWTAVRLAAGAVKSPATVGAPQEPSKYDSSGRTAAGRGCAGRRPCVVGSPFAKTSRRLPEALLA